MSLFRGRVPIVAALVVLVAAGLFVFADSDDGGDPADSRPGATSAPGDSRSDEEVRREMLAAVAQHPSFAGVYINGELGMVILATGDLDWFEFATADYSARNRRVSIESAEYTMLQLEEAIAAINLVEWREERGVPIASVGMAPEANRVLIALLEFTAEHESALREAYGDIVMVVEQGSFEAGPGSR